MADSLKREKRALWKIVGIPKINTIITDSKASNEDTNAFMRLCRNVVAVYSKLAVD